MGDDEPNLDPARAAALLRRQDALQTEARAVVADLDLPNVLAHAGRPVRVGSSVLGLMVWRDIDYNVLCDAWSADRAFEAVRPLAAHSRVRKLRYSNETGPFNATGDFSDEGYYWGVRYRSPAGDDWELDLWFLPAPAPRPELRMIETCARRLTPDLRLAILWIKDEWCRRPTYGRAALSVDIYDAVLERGVRTPAEFAAYLRARGKPDE